MNLLRLRYFVEAAKYESFSMAARSVYTTQPNISKQIKLMEEELDIKLFTRGERSISLTPAGKHIFEELKNIPDIIDSVFFQAKKINLTGMRNFVIGSLMFPSITAALGTAIKALYGEDSGIAYEVELGSFTQIRAGLASRHYDMVLLYSFDIPGIEHSTKYKVISRQPGAIIVNTSHPLAGRSGLSLIDFKDYDFVTTSPNESLMNYNGFIDICVEHGFVPKIARTVRTFDSLLLCVELGLGVCLIDATVPLTDYDNLVMLPIDDDVYSEIAVVWLDDNQDLRIEQITDELCTMFSMDNQVIYRQIDE